MKYIIWTSSMDLSASGVETFCRETAGRVGKTEAELRSLPLMELASCYMWNERRRQFHEASKRLNVPVNTPILVLADKADFLNKSHKECYVLSGERLSEILHKEDGVPITFYSDGKDIHCEELVADGSNHYLYRAVTNLKGLHAFVSMVERGDIFTESQLSEFSESLAPRVHQLMGWPADRLPLDHQIQAANKKKMTAQSSEKQAVSLER